MKTPIYPCLWFDGKAQEAAAFYCSIFKNSKIMSDNGMVVIFELNDRQFMGLNAGPMFKFNEAISFVINCENQEEIDYYWDKLRDEGMESMCGWVQDKYGVFWQVVPTVLPSLLSDPSKAQRVVKAFMQMKKFEIDKLMSA